MYIYIVRMWFSVCGFLSYVLQHVQSYGERLMCTTSHNPQMGRTHTMYIVFSYDVYMSLSNPVSVYVRTCVMLCSCAM